MELYKIMHENIAIESLSIKGLLKNKNRTTAYFSSPERIGNVTHLPKYVAISLEKKTFYHWKNLINHKREN